jgi:hypothetical protein
MRGISGHRTASATRRLAWPTVALVLLGGCGPSEMGTIDLTKSKAIAAEKGVDNRGAPKKTGGPRRTSVEPGRGTSRK